MADKRRKLGAGLAALVAFSLVVCPLGWGATSSPPVSAQGQFTFPPHITPLAMTRTAQALAIQYRIDQTLQPEDIRVPVADGVWMVEHLTSTVAIERCGGEGFTFGDVDAGVCLVPGDETYYVWIGRGEVLEVEADPGNPNQAEFRLAVQQAASDRSDLARDRATRGLAILALGLSFAGIVPACATIIGCFLGVGAAMGSVGGFAYGNGNVMQDEDDLDMHAGQVRYFYCLLQGSGDLGCRDEAGGDHDASDQ